MTKKTILWITRTAVFTALLVSLQFVSAPMGSHYLTGSLVNLTLAVSVMICGLATGLTVAAMSPVFAWLAGLGSPFAQLIPFIALGNMSLVVVWKIMGGLGGRHKAFYFLAPFAAAIVKFAALYTGIVLIAVPYILELNSNQAAAISLTFSYPQIITASIGGIAALTVISPIKKAIKPRGG